MYRGDAIETNECEGLKIGDTVTFEVAVSVKECPVDPAQRVRNFEIYPVGLGERLNITLNLICECECEKADQEVRKLNCLQITQLPHQTLYHKEKFG